nr:unnamed protein product [Callosobruchus chinensis]
MCQATSIGKIYLSAFYTLVSFKR